MQFWDVLVIGGGHAGYEAAFAAATMGNRCLLISMQKKAIGRMSCNPAIGGIGKGQLVKEIDALGGIMGIVADKTALQFRTLNTKKGSAVQATRCQSDMNLYSKTIQEILFKKKNLSIFEGEVIRILLKKNKIIGVLTSKNEKIFTKTIVLTGGTFLRGKTFIGEEFKNAGRRGENAANEISMQLEDIGLKLGRLKTGTPPRLDKKTIDWKKLELQKKDKIIKKFSFWDSKVCLPQLNCHIAYTNERTHKIISNNIQTSAMYNGNIQSTGPRYCPSIEDKIMRFPDKTKHQIFLEPTSLDSNEIYPNGISTSLSKEVQKEFVASIQGLEKAKILKSGYAVEYDFVLPQQLKASLEIKAIDGLFLAGQINGTTGYEEAAAQGILAGINATRKNQEKEAICLTRDNSYIGVLVDDLITKGTLEPYRMFTSRCEYRLLLREDNADQRLCEIGYKIGLLSPKKYQQFCEKKNKIQSLRNWVSKKKFKLNSQVLNFCEINSIQTKDYSLKNLVKKPTVFLENLKKIFPEEWKKEIQYYEKEHIDFINNELKYEGYIKRQTKFIQQYQKMLSQKIPASFNYNKIGGLSNEVREKLLIYKPENLAQCAKISGITPAAVGILMVHLKNFRKKHAA